MARPKNTEERREQIVEGLLQVMAAHGYEGASIPRIAEAAGLAPGLVHYHFKSKLEILLALIELLGQRFEARFLRLLSEADVRATPRARVYAFLDAHVALGRDADPNAVACWVGIGAEALRERSVERAYKQALCSQLAKLEDLLGETLREEGRSTESTAELAAGLMSTILGCFQLAVAAQAAPRGFAAPTLRRMADGLIATQVETHEKTEEACR